MEPRILLICSQDEDFYQAVKTYSKSLAIFGFKYQTELMKCKQIDRNEYLKAANERKKNKNKSNNNKLFWIPKYDPRIPYLRSGISKNILEQDSLA
jgi:hypothetical protein